MLIRLISALIFLRASAELGAQSTGRSLHDNDWNFSDRDHMGPGLVHTQQPELDPPPGPAFNLRVQVSDMLSRQPLSQALVEVYVNYTVARTVLTGEDGGALLHVPYHSGVPVTVVASKDGYIRTLLPCKTSRMPIFSSVTISLLGLNQGNIWLFEDSVLITGKTSEALSQPVVQFPQSLLNLTEDINVTSVRAYLTFPKLSSESDGFLHTVGIVGSKSGLVSVELSPMAAVSVQLFSGDTELHVSGSVRLSLSVPDSCGLQMSSVVPAWFFNRTTGGWMRKGLGKLVSVDGKLLWTFTAPHLGYWIAAPLSSTRGFFGLAIPIDFILQHSSLLMVVLGGALVIVICLLVGLLCHRSRSSPSGSQTKRILPVTRKDQTTSTCDDDVFELQAHDGLLQPLTENHHNSSISIHNGSVIANPGAVCVTELDLNPGPTDVTCLFKTTEQMRSLAENLFFYNQPVAILHAPAFFHVEEQEERNQWSRSATLPRAGASNGAAPEPLSEDSFTQTQTKGPTVTQNQEGETEDQLGVLEEPTTSTARGHFSLPESVSVPGTLNRIRDNRHSLLAFGEFSRIPPPQPPRAWFVSLEGKPAAEIHYAVSEQQRRRRPVDSRDTSLDSGVDMSELNQSSGRRTVTLERKATFVKSTSGSKPPAPQ
ncbi:protein FAM171B-like isoform X1 [Hippoglossus hippoglossus]|uniref:protein FAM171B-like isoform X1 n=1 Tax=Hippoglossus hippoglossus TaxID=8267 RepID=UPI00148E5C01|nr:protein FAM171B-like isoform X1 [Hippoglossus hippoglossus]